MLVHVVRAVRVEGSGGSSRPRGQGGSGRSERPAPTVSPGLLLARLRGDGEKRPRVDPGLAGGLRDWLEDGLAAPVGGLSPDAEPIRVTKEDVTRVLTCEALSRSAVRGGVTLELARGVLVDALFRQWVTVGSISDPWQDAMSAIECEADERIAEFVTGLDGDCRRRLAAEVRDHADRIRATWPPSSPAWLARTQERIEVPLVGGAVVLSGVVDLAFGAPCEDRASVCLVELKSGVRRLEHRGDLHFYALLETLRSGAHPFRIATYYSATAELDVEPVGEDVLLSALHRTLAAAQRLCKLEAGTAPDRTPNPLCAWCAELPHCPPGQDRAGSLVPRAQGDPAGEERSLFRDRGLLDEDVA